MKREIETKFYEFNQNNSGGIFDVDENVCNRVIIEAIDAKHAQSLFEPMIENQTGSCPCCGDRWSSYYDPYEIELYKWKKKAILLVFTATTKMQKKDGLICMVNFQE